MADLTDARRIWLLTEAVLFYGGTPVLIWCGWFPVRALLPLLLVVALLCVITLHLDADFTADRLWNPRGLALRLSLMLKLFLGGVVALVAFMALLVSARAQGWFHVPAQVDWFILPRQDPWVYALLLIAYPMLSVYPQEIIYRGFFFHRYAPAFGSPKVALVVNALLFGWGHIIFHNPVAVCLSIAGGALFATTHLRTKSLFAASVEHTLYGCLLFTLGLGWYFYGGSVQAIPADSLPGR